MKRFIDSTGYFFRTLGGCISKAWQETDCHYHIPKSRFKDPASDAQVRSTLPKRRRRAPRNAFLGSFRDCVAQAWEDTYTRYHIPKSRFMDAEYNETAYRSSPGPGLLRRTGWFMVTLKQCISMAWEASDTFHHLPKSRYQDADHIRKLMKLSPKPRGNLLHMPFYIGRGFIVGDAGGKGWTVRPHDEEPDEVFFIPDQQPGAGDKPEIEM